MAAGFERHVAPGLVAVLAGCGDQPPPPDLLAGHGIEGDDYAGVGSAVGQTASPRHGLAVGDDRPGALDGAMPCEIEDGGFPDHLAGLGVEGE